VLTWQDFIPESSTDQDFATLLYLSFPLNWDKRAQRRPKRLRELTHAELEALSVDLGGGKDEVGESPGDDRHIHNAAKVV
jgi:hypothetical protein